MAVKIQEWPDSTCCRWYITDEEFGIEASENTFSKTGSIEIEFEAPYEGNVTQRVSREFFIKVCEMMAKYPQMPHPRKE